MFKHSISAVVFWYLLGVVACGVFAFLKMPAQAILMLFAGAGMAVLGGMAVIRE